MKSPPLFEWDAAKAELNFAKHRIRFEVATGVFEDRRHADFDASHGEDGEMRRKVVGTIQGNLLRSSTPGGAASRA